MFDNVAEWPGSPRPEPWQRRETTINYIGGPECTWPWPIAAFAWCFGYVYRPSVELDEIVTPAALWQVMATYLALLNLTFGEWKGACIALGIGMIPMLAVCVIAGAVWLVVTGFNKSGIPTDL